MIGNEAQWVHLTTGAIEVAGTAIVVGAFGSLLIFLQGLRSCSAGLDQMREHSPI